MSDRLGDDEYVVAKHDSGTRDEEQLNTSIAHAWREALEDPKERAEIADLLGVQEGELDANNPPFRAEVKGAGTFGADILIALAVGFALGFAKKFGEEIGGAAGKKAAEQLRILWRYHIRDRVSPPGSGQLGPEKEGIEED